MKKQFLTPQSYVKQLIVSACLLGMSTSFAGAQEVATPGSDGNQALAAGDAMRQPASETRLGLPSIRNSRNGEQRQAPTPPTSRPAKRIAAEVGAFESYAEGVTGQKLSVFGKDLFSDVPSTFAPFDSVQVNQEYVIGTGDELQIRGWGMVDIDVNATVDRGGAVYIPRVGSVKVSGVKYKDLQGYLKKAVGKLFTNFDLTASIAQTRAVQVYVVGHAVRPGTYTLSAMSTLLNALFTSGGPDSTGSMRNIQLKRGSQTVSSFDLYDIVAKGDKTRDVTLQDGDVIYIPEVGPLVALTGNVKQPGIFELKGKTDLSDVLSWAGGFDSAAETKQVIVEKNVDNQYTAVADLIADKTLNSAQLANVVVNPTDILRVFSPGAVPVEAQVQSEYVRIAGEARKSGIFLLKKGETLREFIVRVGGANENGYLYALQLNRESVRRNQQAKLNEVADRFERDMESNATQKMAATTDKENAAKTAAEVEQQRRIVQRMRSVKAEGRIVLDLPGLETEVKNLPDVPLQNGDSIYIPRRPGTVDVLGSVFQQNAFVYRPQRTAADYLEQAGGLTANADKSEMYVIRADGTARSGRNSGLFGSVGSTAINPGDAIVIPEKIDRSSFVQSLKEWTAIFYQFGLGAAGLKVLKD